MRVSSEGRSRLGPFSWGNLYGQRYAGEIRHAPRDSCEAQVRGKEATEAAVSRGDSGALSRRRGGDIELEKPLKALDVRD